MSEALQCRRWGASVPAMTPPARPRPFTRAQMQENAAFLRALARTGNAREAARVLGVHRSTFTKRRASHPGFAAQWTAALAAAHARLTGANPAARADGAARPMRTASGRVQLGRLKPRALDRAAEQAFLTALAATANVRLAAAAAGFSHGAFYHRRRQDPGFAREMRMALAEGYDRIEAALLEGWSPDSHEQADWRHNDRAPIPPMSPDQALQLLHLHQKEVRLGGTHELLRTRRGEPREVQILRLQLVGEQRQERERERFRVAEAARREAEERRQPVAEPPATLPALDQVTGWSKASGKAPHHAGRALFGGWRLGDGEDGEE